MTADAAPKNVTEAIARIMGELPAIGKKRDPNGGVKYAFRGIEAITAEAQELCAKYGVVFFPEVLDMETKDIVVNGNPWTDTFLDVQYSIVHGPSDTARAVRTRGIGRDNSDKGANKAMTAAFKYALIQTFMIADPKDDGDKESHATSSRAGRPSSRPASRRVDPETGEIAGEVPSGVSGGVDAGAPRDALADRLAPSPAPIDEMKPRELNAALAKAGLPTGGTVAEMRERLGSHLGAPAGPLACIECGTTENVTAEPGGHAYCPDHESF